MAKASDSLGVDLGFLSSFMIARGVVAILFGIMALIWPGLTFATLAIFVTLWLMASGVINIVQAVTSIGKGSLWLLTLAFGVLQLGVGAYLVQRPALALSTFVALIGLVLVVQGIVEVIASFSEAESPYSNRWLGAVVGFLSVVAGLVIWQYPVSGGLAFVWVLGLFALVSGPLWIAAGMDLKRVRPA